MNRKARLFWPIFLGLLAADFVTKRVAQASLELYQPEEILGSLLRFTLAYNPGAAFGIDVGPASRIVFTVLGVIALGVILWMYRATPPDDRIQVTALGLIAGGAMGNLVDRLRSAAGVVDFVDVGIGDARFWTFNLADAGITVGALLLAVTLWNETSAQESDGGVGGGDGQTAPATESPANPAGGRDADVP